MANDWSHREVTLAVEAYFAMLERELKNLPINKSAVRRELLPKLDNRSNGSLEFKNCNISAALLSLGLPSVEGYKPRRNYQHDLLHSVIAETLQTRPGLTQAVEDAIEGPVERPAVTDVLSIFDVDPPERSNPYDRFHEPKGSNGPIIQKNYLEQESRNRAVGRIGEEIVLDYERARLMSLDKGSLAERIEHVSVDLGDGAGFDIRSFDEHGNDLFIEVKTTRFRKETPFFISANEVEFSQRNAGRFSLYRVYTVSRNPRMFTLPGDVRKQCHLNATNYRGSF